jgi:hypothetical protein
MISTKKTVALLSTSALAAGAANGAILYTNINMTVSAHGALALDLDHDGVPDFQLAFNANNAVKPYITNAPAGSGPFVLSASPNEGLPVTPIGTMVNGSYESAQTVGYFNKDNNNNLQGSWTAAGNIDGYVGLELTGGGSKYYGWAHFIYNSAGVPVNDADTGTLTLVDAAVETNPNTGILTGQTAEAATMPVVNVPPSSQTNYLGGTAQLSVVAVGNPPPTYQWQSGAVGSDIYSNISASPYITTVTSTDGAMSTLTIQNLSLANMADYVVVVSNSSGVITSSVPATLTVIPVTDSPATLVHRYSFQDTAGSTTFADSVGGPSWAGTLNGGAALTGSSLQLSGVSNCYASLPPFITSGYSQMTVEFWADIGSNPIWTRVFFFGSTSGGTKNSGFDYCPFAPPATNSYQNLDFLNLSGGDAYANNNAGFSNVIGKHVTVVIDSINGAMYYYNGASLVSTLNGAAPSLANINDITDVIGQSPVKNDPYLNGTIHEFRVYSGVLSPQAIALNDAVGPANYIQLSAAPTLSATLSAGNIILTWPASDYNFAVQSASALSSVTSWTTLTNVPALVGTNWQATITSPGTPQFFQLIYK